MDHDAAPVGLSSADAEVAAARSELYGLLAAVLSPPTETLAQSVRDGSLYEAMRALAQRFPAPTGTAGAAQAEVSLPADGPPEDVVAEYTRLFSHIFSVKCPPYEAEYDTAHVFMKTQLMADIAGFYHAFGVRVAQGAHERPDHIAIELEFMALLTAKEAVARESGSDEHVQRCRDAEKAFIEDHLGRWVGVFRDLVHNNTRSPCFCAATDLAARFIACEADFLGARPVPVAPPGAASERDARPPGPDVEGVGCLKASSGG